MVVTIELGALITIESLKITSPLIGSLTVSPVGGMAIALAVLGICALLASDSISIPSLSNLFGSIEVEETP